MNNTNPTGCHGLVFHFCLGYFSITMVVSFQLLFPVKVTSQANIMYHKNPIFIAVTCIFTFVYIG